MIRLRAARVIGTLCATLAVAVTGMPPVAAQASARQVPVDCSAPQRVGGNPINPAGDTSVSAWLEKTYCPAENQWYVRVNSRNNRASGKSDWAIALKGTGSTCHARPTIAPPAVHPHVAAGRTWATDWQLVFFDVYWGEVETTYPNGSNHFGQTGCWVGGT